MRILVGGGTGLVGSAIVRSLASSETVREIVVTSRSQARLNALVRDPRLPAGRVTALVVDADTMLDGASLRAAIERTAPTLDAAVASLGAGTPDGRRLSALSRKDFDATMAEMLGAHAAFAIATLPLLADDGIYLGIGGGAAFAPMHGGGAMSVAAAAQAMMTRVLAAENDRPTVRILELVVDAHVEASAVARRHGTIVPEDVGAVVEELLRTGACTRPRVVAEGPILRMRSID